MFLLGHDGADDERYDEKYNRAHDDQSRVESRATHGELSRGEERDDERK